jgi:hypothetical protein
MAGFPQRVTNRQIFEDHAELLRMLRPEGTFLSAGILSEVFPQGIPTVEDKVIGFIREAWPEISEDDNPNDLLPAWYLTVFEKLLRIREGGGLLRPFARGGDRALSPDAVVVDPSNDYAERMLVYRRQWDEPLTKARLDQPSAVDQAAELCRDRSVPLALLSNGREWVLVHARPLEATSSVVFDADYWLDERLTLRLFVQLLSAERIITPATLSSGKPSDSLASLFARSAADLTGVTEDLSRQVRAAVDLFIGEIAQLDRGAGGRLLEGVEPRQVYRASLTVMMRLVFLLYAEEHRLLPLDDELYAENYSVHELYEQLDTLRTQWGERFVDNRYAAWPRLLALFRVIHAGSEHTDLHVLPYGGSLFDPARYTWLVKLRISDRVVLEILNALLVLHRAKSKTDELLSYRGLDVEQIGHVYEGLLENSCIRTELPRIGLIGKIGGEPLLDELDAASAKGTAKFRDWLKSRCGATETELKKAFAFEVTPTDEATLKEACDGDLELAARIRPILGLLRRDLRDRPVVFPPQSVLAHQVGDRRATGTHYTPRALAEEVVEHALAPLCFREVKEESGKILYSDVKAADELLNLRVLDPAVGSGAFLVSACRYIGDRVVEAWDRDAIPDDVKEIAIRDDGTLDRDDLALTARRMAADQCLYGADRDDMALELAKLSLWLVTLAKGKPFSFLDHALRHGDSLIGTVRETQIKNFHIDGGTATQGDFSMVDEKATAIFEQAVRLRKEIAAMPDRDIRDTQAKAVKLDEADALAEQLRLLSDTVVAAALCAADEQQRSGLAWYDKLNDDDVLPYDRVLSGVSMDVKAALAGDHFAETRVREQVDDWLRGSGPRTEPIRPLHWPLEFPEILVGGSAPGFDAIVGNPPFSGGQNLTGDHGVDYREFLVEYIACGKRGSADLCSYFLLRDAEIAPNGRIGIIATNTIAQGGSREVGLEQLLDPDTGKWTVDRAWKSRDWPGTAAVVVSMLWLTRRKSAPKSVLEETLVEAITAELDAQGRVSGRLEPLVANADQAFQGAIVLGLGFILDHQAAGALIASDPTNRDVIFPYLNGDDLYSGPDVSASRSVINFYDWTEEEACRYPAPFEVVEREVKPVRAGNNRAVYRDKWWQYAEKRPALTAAIAPLDRVIAITRHSKTGLPLLTSTDQVMSEAIVIFASDDPALLALLSSAVHYFWAVTHGSSLKGDPRYTPTGVFEPFPKPMLSDKLRDLGTRLDEERREIMLQRQLGLTDLYNLINAPTVDEDDDVSHVRGLHRDIDEEVRRAYAADEDADPDIREFEQQHASEPLPAWKYVGLDHGFHPNRFGEIRYTISPKAQYDVLDKLLALNHYRARQEAVSGVRARKKPRKKSGSPFPRPKPALDADGTPIPEPEPIFDDGGLFQPDGTLF